MMAKSAKSSRGSTASFSALLRQTQLQQSNPRAELRERFSAELEQLVRSNEGEIESITLRPNFWNDFFLLRVNETFIATLVNSLTMEDLMDQKTNIQNIVFHSLNMIKEGTDKRKLNAGQLLCTLLRQIFAKKGWPNFNFDVVNLICGLDSAPIVLEDVVNSVQDFLQSTNDEMVICGLHLMVVLVTATDNVNGNIFNEHLLRKSLFMALVHVVKVSEDSEMVQNALLLISILSNYRKYEAAENAFRRCLANIDDPTTLTMIVRLFAEQSRKCRDIYINILNDEDARFKVSQGVHGVLSYLWNWKGAQLKRPVVAAENSTRALPPLEASLLLVVYDLSETNRAFLAICCLEVATSYSPADSPTGLSLPLPADVSRSTSSISSKPDGEGTQSSQISPLVPFLSFSSYLLQHSSTARALIYGKLVLLLLNVLTEDSGIMRVLCGGEKMWNVELCRQRPPALPFVKGPRPLVCAVLDVLVSFLSHNLRKKLQADMYCLCLAALHHILCHLRDFRLRIEYHWAELWRALDTLSQFVCSNASAMAHRALIGDMIFWVYVIWNFFVHHGGVFLPGAAVYDTLYYEIIRSRETFARCDEFLKSCGSAELPFPANMSGNGQPHTGLQTNIRKIIDHFVNKIEIFQKSNRIVTLTAEQVLGVIKMNSDSLELSPLHPNLRVPTRCSEMPARQLLRVVASDMKCKILGVNTPYDADIPSGVVVP